MNKNDAEEKIVEFFQGKHDKEKVRKIKNLAMSYRIRLVEKRKKFCKKCNSMNLRIKGIKNRMKTVVCSDCGNLMRWRIK